MACNIRRGSWACGNASVCVCVARATRSHFREFPQPSLARIYLTILDDITASLPSVSTTLQCRVGGEVAVCRAKYHLRLQQQESIYALFEFMNNFFFLLFY